MNKKILIVEDEESISNIIAFNLKNNGYEVEQVFDGEKALDISLKNDFDLILLDIMLPNLSGIEICKEIRKKSIVPIIMLTAKDEEVQKLLGLEVGADDYITKPFKMKELIARIRAKMRRVELQKEDKVIRLGNLTFDMKAYKVEKSGKVLNLTITEFNVLKHLIINRSNVITRETILEEVWGYEYFGDIRTVDVTVRRIREKIEDNPGEPKYLLTKRGVGYYCS